MTDHCGDDRLGGRRGAGRGQGRLPAQRRVAALCLADRRRGQAGGGRRTA